MAKGCVRNLVFIAVAALLVGVLANKQDGVDEKRLTVCVLCSCVVGIGLFALCSADATARWIWPIIEATAAAVIAFLWFGVYKARFAPNKREQHFPFVELGCYASAYFVSCFVLYMLRSMPIRQEDLAKPLAKLCGMFATDFGAALLSYASELSMFEAGFLIVLEQLTFHGIWLMPRTALSMMESRNTASGELHLPGTHDEPHKVAVCAWQKHCDSIAISGAAATALCYTLLSILHGHASGSDSYCSINDRCAWMDSAHGHFWATTAATLLAMQVLCAIRLNSLKNRGGVVGFAAFVFNDALAKAIAMAGLNYTRHLIFSDLCPMCSVGMLGKHMLFANMSIAYATLVIAMLVSIAMALLSPWLPEAARPTMLHMQNATGLQAATACSKVFSTMAGSTVMVALLGKDALVILALGFTAVLWPVYVVFLRPAVAAAVQRGAPRKTHKD